MADGLLSLNWNNHGATFCHTLASLREKDKYTDVTVSCGGRFYQVHKLVLSTCSDYFSSIFEATPCKHPVIVLRDVQCDELESLLNYMYKGVVSVAQSDLSRLIKVAELLQIKGLAVPDEPPPSSKHSSNKRTNDDRPSRSSNENSSPYPKRRRRRESDSYQTSQTTTFAAQSRNDDPIESPWTEDQDSRHTDDRAQDTTSQDRIPSPVMVNVDESLVKEEILDDDQGQNDLSEGDYISGLGDASGDGSQDAGGLLIPKFDDATDQSGGPLSEPVVEALAGPSGLQGWADGGDMARRMASLTEGFDTQDMSSSVGLPSQASGQPPRQMVTAGLHAIPGNTTQGMAPQPPGTITQSPQKHHKCPLCPFSTNYRWYLREHMESHAGFKRYSCPFCPVRFSNNTTLKNHLKTHTGEKPFKCDYCSYMGSRRSSLRSHMLRRHKEHWMSRTNVPEPQ